MRDLDGADLGGQLGIVQEDRRAGMRHDVGDLVGVEPEVDRDQDTTVGADAEEGGQESRRVRADDRDALPVLDPSSSSASAMPRARASRWP